VAIIGVRCVLGIGSLFPKAVSIDRDIFTIAIHYIDTSIALCSNYALLEDKYARHGLGRAMWTISDVGSYFQVGIRTFINMCGSCNIVEIDIEKT